jgi:predicted kinase
METRSLDGPIGSSSSRLVVIRGNSGSGKSAVAAGVRAARPEGTVAIVGQDVLRREVLGTGGDLHGHATGLVDLTARYALGRGFDVVLEGVFNADWYRETLLRLIADHRGTSLCYVYDLPFDETLRRHAMKPVADAFGEAEMRQWWRGLQLVDGLEERVITEAEDLESTVARVLDDCWSTNA